MKLGPFAVALAAFSTLVSSSAFAGSPASLSRDPGRFLAEGSNVLAPFAFVRFCVQNVDDCRTGSAALVDWNAATRGSVEQVNRRVNRTMKQRPDVGDVWSVGEASGDCEDFVLTKRRLLVNAGIPSAALRIAVARTSEGEGHAVLVVRSSAGDFVLDNRMDRIVAWHETDLTWIKISSGENPKLWKAIDNRNRPPASMRFVSRKAPAEGAAETENVAYYASRF